MDDEKTVLLDSLNAQRAHALEAIEGLGDADLRRAPLPSGWTMLGMLRHLTMDDERFWFDCVVAGDAEAIAEVMGPDDAWTVGGGMSADGVVAAYRDQIARSDEIIAAASLDGGRRGGLRGCSATGIRVPCAASWCT